MTQTRREPATTQDPQERNQQMLERYLDGETLAAIGEDYGVTRERVRQIVTKLGGPSAEESRAKRIAARQAAQQARLDDFMAEFGATARRLSANGHTRDQAIRRLALLNPSLDTALAEEALRQSTIVFDRYVDNIFSDAVVEAGIWYLLGSEHGLAPDRAAATELLDLDLMEELASILGSGDATAEDVSTVLGVIAAAQQHVTAEPDTTITGARYEELRRELVDALGWVSAKGSSPWPPTRQTLMRRYATWSRALASLGIATTSRGRTPGLVKYTDADYVNAARSFLAECARSGASPTYAAYEDRAQRLMGTDCEIPSGSSLRNYFGAWSDVVRLGFDLSA
ncbi:sigma factor-like helix-turn-helix DNA-binding protein [Zafaria sp. J156]|uniref:sigma factor-like helix-turn-helix DNA-binding protein n=1 Tax=Zafaria sp. J156 TaxID=3116490 RepID=UPI002E781F35|nr:sigma factor-like helix-turn-helix DNA-binding protein [Zafaria sp. J156]MEE1622407.1 sigma factor-like helix-turn-helix DNA-binding protein [Zafaria sp. J156]